MIGIIGIKRVIILLVFATFNAVLATMIYSYVLPQSEITETKLKSGRGKLTSVQGDIQRMQIEFDQLDQQQGRFDALKADGFFSTQDRGDAKALFSKIQNDSRVISATVSVKPGVIDDDPEAIKANHKVLMSQIKIEVKAFDDNDIYRYIDMVEKTFPGHVSLNSIVVKRTRDVSSALLRAISAGASPELVIAEIEMSWRTIIPDNQVIPDAGRLR